jgi:mRNA interferase MazF
MGVFAVGSVVTIEFPYPDLTASKRRPALILAHANEEEYVLAEITSQPYPYSSGTFIDKAHFVSGELRFRSQVRSDRIFTAHQSAIGKVIGVLQPNIVAAIMHKTIALFPVNLYADSSN